MDLTPDKEYPEEGELVITTIQDIFDQGAFATLDEYDDNKGMLHISEMSLKWVRNIRDYVREGQKEVLQVLGVRPERGHIDLSLRRVSDYQKKAKLKEVKERQRAEKLLELLGDKLDLSSEDLEKIAQEFLKEYKTVYGGLEDLSLHEEKAHKLDLPEEWKSSLVKLADKNIKPSLAEITGYVELKNYDSEGVEEIKKALQKIEDCPRKEGVEEIEVEYISAPNYRVKIKAKNYKVAEKNLREAVEEGINSIKKNNGEGEFHRELEE